MKKIIFIFLSILVLAIGKGQTFKATIIAGTSANRIIAAIKPSANFTGQPINFQFTFAIPSSVGPRPAVSIVNNFYSSYFSDAATSVVQSATYLTDYVYLINFSGSTLTSKTYSANVEDKVVEILFTGNIGNASNIKLVQLPNGLATLGFGSENGNYNFYTEFNTGDKTNAASMFYQNGGGTVSNNVLGFSGYSFVTLASGSLPLTWLDFSVQHENNNALLQWKVSENNMNEHYEVEKSTDGRKFVPIINIAKTAGTGIKDYRYQDAVINNLNTNVVFYRIKQVDVNGQFTYSVIRSLMLAIKDHISLYPNPARQGFYVAIPLRNISGQIVLQLISAAGNLIDKREITSAEASNYYYNIVPLNIASGKYWLKIYDGNTLRDSKQIMILK